MPQKEEEIITVEVFPKELQPAEIGMSSIIGTRKSQQDSIFGCADQKGALGIVCDGMGGLAGGELASKTAVHSIVDAWYALDEITDVPQFLETEAENADQKVFLQEDGRGKHMEAGSTVVAVVVKERELYWLSVGDSRIYIIRGNEIMAVNREHNYRMTLDRKLKAGEITQEEYDAEEYRAEALISYLGMGHLPFIDVNRKPFLLEDQDIIILCSDGLYRSLAEDEILAIAKRQETMQGAADELTRTALGEKQSGQDNTSVVILRYRKNRGRI